MHLGIYIVVLIYLKGLAANPNVKTRPNCVYFTSGGRCIKSRTKLGVTTKNPFASSTMSTSLSSPHHSQPLNHESQPIAVTKDKVYDIKFPTTMSSVNGLNTNAESRQKTNSANNKKFKLKVLQISVTLVGIVISVIYVGYLTHLITL